MKKTKWLALLLVVLMSISFVLAGCGNKGGGEETVEQAGQNEPSGSDSDGDDKDSEGDQAEYDGQKILDYYVGTEPETLNSQHMWGAPDMFIANMFIEGLMRSGKEEGELVPGVAESYTYDEELNSYSFKLNPNAKWEDGTQVTAEDFFFGWKLAMDETGPYYTFITDYIEGAEEYQAFSLDDFLSEKDPEFKTTLEKLGEVDPEDEDAKKELEDKKNARIENMSDEEKTEFQNKKDELWAQVGATASEDGSEINITLKVPAPYFPSLTAFPVYNPVNKDFYEAHTKAGDYCIEASGLPCNGPWKVSEWKHEDSFTLVRNENYWNKDNVKIDELNIKIVNDVATRTNLLKTGKLDGSAIQANDLPEFQDMATLEQYNLQPLVDMPDFASFYVEFNHFSNKVTQNANIRKALAYAMDRTSFVEKISLGDNAALGFIPTFFPGYEKSFREEVGMELIEDNNKEEAKKLLEAGLKELELDELPELDMLIDTSDISQKVAEKFQADWNEIGIKVNLVPLPWGERLNRLKNGDFAMSSSGWGPDYPDPLTFLEIFRSDSENNSGKYNNPKYDELINKAMGEKDAKTRMGYLYDAEKILIQEDMVIAPQYYRIAHWTYKNYLTGVVNRGIGANTDFYFADIDMTAKVLQKGE